MYWRTKDGEIIAYKDLTDTHLLNILNMYIRRAAEQLTIPEQWIAFQELWEVAEEKQLELPYQKHKPKQWEAGFHESYLRLPKCSISINLSDWSDIKNGRIKPDQIEGEMPESFELSKQYIILDEPHTKALITSYERWNDICEAMEESFPHHGLGYSWGLG